MADNVLARLSTEWLNGNQHRAYPLDDSTGGVVGTIPTPLLVDAFFIASKEIEPTSVYISKIDVSAISMQIYLSAKVNGSVKELGLVADVALDTAFGTQIPIVIKGDDFVLDGAFVIGDMSYASQLPASSTMTTANGKIFPGCIRCISCLSGIVINGELLTGVVTLQAGDGITFSKLANNVVTISAAEYTIELSNTDIVTDSELLAQAVEAFGKPVRTVCGQEPDSNGNITIQSTDEEETEYFDAIKVGDGTIMLKDPKSNAVCSVDTALDTLLANVQAINTRISTITQAQTDLDNKLNTINVGLARIN